MEKLEQKPESPMKITENTSPESLLKLDLNNLDIGSLLFVTTYNYYELMVEQLLAKTCPFCTIDHKINKVLYEDTSWRAWIKPVAGKKHQRFHLVIAHRRHITHIRELESQCGNDLIKVFQWASGQFGIEGREFIMRFGDPHLNAGTIRHLHGNIQIPDNTGELKIALAKSPDKITWHYRLIGVLEKICTGIKVKDLNPKPKEQNLVEGRV